jgi:proteic killer suppression protein
MEVRFRTRKLRKQYEKFREAEKAYGKDIGRKYIQRINIIKQVHDIKELCSLPGLYCHPLKRDRLGQWAIKLTRYYRLIFKPEGDLLEIARIEEVSKHYDD